MNKTQLLVLGGGPGGYSAAFKAADLGQQVTLVDTDKNPGGVCLHRGCIPSKALLHAAKILSEAKEAKNFGIDFPEPKIDLDKLRSWKDGVVKNLTGGVGLLGKQRKVTLIQGRGKFLSSNSIEIDHADGTKSTLEFEKCILATGSRPNVFPGAPASARIIDSTGALELKDIPKSMLLVGGGYIGLELGTVYAELGSKVDVVEVLPQLMTGSDRDLASVLEKRLRTIFGDIYLSTKILKMEDIGKAIKIYFEDAEGKKFDKEYEKVLVAIGRRPNTDNIGIEKTKIVVDAKGFIKTNGQRQTNDPSIYAIGDITGNPMLAHKASHEAFTAADSIAGHKVVFEPKAIPAVVFTDPEMAWCGLTEAEARAQGLDIEVTKFPWGASGRAITLDRVDGLTKLIIDRQSHRVLGVGIVGPHAGDLISEGVLAIEMGAVAEDLALCIHPHPSLSETIMEAAEMFTGPSTHIYKPKRT